MPSHHQSMILEKEKTLHWREVLVSVGSMHCRRPKITHRISEDLDDKHTSRTIAIDLTKAFDNVWHITIQALQLWNHWKGLLDHKILPNR